VDVKLVTYDGMHPCSFPRRRPDCTREGAAGKGFAAWRIELGQAVQAAGSGPLGTMPVGLIWLCVT
jgi:hypothetical protein